MLEPRMAKSTIPITNGSSPIQEKEIPPQLSSLCKERTVPINLRQSGNSDANMLISTRVRKSPYWHLTHKAGCWAYSVYNRMYHPRAYVPLAEGGLLKEYEYLTQCVTLWNVAVERQIQVRGPDAAKFVDLVITRSVAKIPPGKCRYVILCNDEGGIINDPVLLRVAEDTFWFSISDSDLLLWFQGINSYAHYDVKIDEIDVAPVQIQGPYSANLMTKIFGEDILNMRYYTMCHREWNGMNLVISRTGFSAEVGFEIYLQDATLHADRLWNALLEAGAEFDIKVIAPSHIRRLEAGILSYGQDMDLETNPYEVRLGWQVDLNKDHFIGKEALAKIKAEGVKQSLVGIKMAGTPIEWYNEDFYLLRDTYSGENIGYVTSAFYSPNLQSNIALAMVPISYAKEGTAVQAVLPNDGPVAAEVVPVPFVDPKKKKPAQKLRS